MTPRQMLPVLHYLRQVKADPDPAWDDDAALLEQYRCHGDESAFEGLVRRHGPRVLAVCRRVLGDQHDAEDAFQATFLFLARKSASLRQPDRLGSWLHAVAVRTALKARERRRPLLPLADDLASAADHDMLWHDLRPILDEAIASLPGRYRDPVILCFLEGASTSQAAQRLGCPPGTISSRLGRARVLLRARLARRGVSVPVRMLGGVLPAALRDAVVSPLLLKSTCSIGVRVGAVSAAVAALAKGVAMRMMLQKIQGAVLVLLGVVGLGVGAMVYQGKAQEPPATAPAVSPAPAVPIMPPMVSPPPIEDAVQKVQERTKNFVVEASSKRVARLVGEAAEKLRKEIAIKWLDKELPAWDKPCPIRVQIQEGDGHSSASTLAFDAGKVADKSIQLRGVLERLLTCELPHEMTHVILAYRFGRPIPRWADEGAATLAEDDEQQSLYQKALRELLSKPERLIPLRELLTVRDYPSDIGAFYAQSQSVTAFLLEHTTPKEFLALVVLGGMDQGWDNVSKWWVGGPFRNVTEMEQAWLKAVKYKNEVDANQAKPIGQDRPSIPPKFVEAKVEMDRLLLYVPTSYYEPVVTYQKQGEKAVPVTSYQQRAGEQRTTCALGDVRAYLPNGKLFPPELLPTTLRKRQTVLLSTTGEWVHSRYLELMRDDVMILVIPPAKLSTDKVGERPPVQNGAKPMLVPDAAPTPTAPRPTMVAPPPMDAPHAPTASPPPLSPTPPVPPAAKPNDLPSPEHR